MESACCFIGHRNIERASEVQEKLRKELRKLIEQGTTRFIFGDHSEFNTLCRSTHKLKGLNFAKTILK